MKKFQHIITIALTVFFVSSCGGEEKFTVKYYAYYELDGRYSIIGRYEFDPGVTPRTHCYKITYDSMDRPVLAQYLRAGKPGYGVGPYDQVQTKISYHDGYEMRESLNSAGEPVPYPRGGAAEDPSRIFSIRFDLDEYGNRISLTNLNIKGEPYRDTAGVVKYFWDLDNQGRIIGSIGINTDGDSVTDSNWERERHYRYDESGNLTEIKYIARSGEPCQTERGRIAAETRTYDKNGNVIEELYYDLFGNLSGYPDSLSRSYRRSYDDWGRVIRKQNLELSQDGDSLIEMAGCSYYSYDARGNRTEWCIRDSAGNVIIDSMTSVIRFKYDEQGNCIEEIHCLEDGTPATRMLAGYPLASISRTSYNELGFPAETRLYNKDGILSMGYWGHAIQVSSYTFNDNGGRSETAYLDPEGHAATVIFCQGLSKVVRELNHHGRQSFMAFYDTLGNYEYPATHTSYDELGNRIEEKNCDEEGRLMEIGYGALHKYGYNKYGYLLYELIYDEFGDLTDSLNKHDPERPDKRCRDVQRIVADSIAKAKFDSLYEGSWQDQNKE